MSVRPWHVFVAVGCAAAAPPTTAASDTSTAIDCDDLVEVVAGVPGIGGRGPDGVAATETWLSLPQDVALAPDGRWWVVDYNNHFVREVDRTGISRIVAGSGFPSGGDGGPALEEPLDHPTNAVLDPHDDAVLWVAASGNHVVARVDLADSWIDTSYGDGGSEGFAGDGGPASEATFSRPSSVGFDDGGTLYVSDRMNQVVRAITTDTTIDTIAGTPGVAGYTGDGGPALAATLNAPAWTEFDPGNRLDVRGSRLVLADMGNDAVREIDLTTGVIRTLAGPDAGLVGPHDVAIAEDGTVYVADSGNHCIRRITPSGVVEVVAGQCGVEGPAETSVPSSDATFAFPVGVAVGDGQLWITDRNNQTIRRMCL